MHLYSPRTDFCDKSLSRPTLANKEQPAPSIRLTPTSVAKEENEIQRIFQRLLKSNTIVNSNSI
ncbi:hypothetical protein [Undibacterium sp. SXout20W]|uniref:hypothetical protein n=1 Tax=Undibacterium sp. SXout20W TaxID=3413051 RepID=UPI003BEF9898